MAIRDAIRQPPGVLPNGLSLRPATSGDLDGWMAVILAVDAAEIGEPDYTAADVRDDWQRPRFDLSRDAWVVESSSGALVGHGSVWEREPGLVFDGDTYVLPEVASAVESVLLERVCKHARARASSAAPVAAGAVLSVANVASNTVRAAMLSSLGFTVARHFFRMRIDLTELRPSVSQPRGVRIRQVRGDEDLTRVHSTLEVAFSDHWRRERTSFDEFRHRFVDSEGCDPDLWFVAEVDGQVVGALIGLPHATEGGWVSQLGVLPEWRGRGVGEALLHHVFRAFCDRGWRHASLGVDTQNATGAARLYERVGMRRALDIEVWDLPLSHRGP